MALEDDFCDIVKKARLGRRLSVDAVARTAGLAAQAVAELEAGRRTPTEHETLALAGALDLRPQPLASIATGRWAPAPTSPSQVETVIGDIGGYAVKGYVLHDRDEAIFVDTAYHAGAMLKTVAQLGARLTAICLTHGHADHADGLDEILARWPVPVYLGAEDEDLLSWRPSGALRAPTDGATLTVGRHTVRFMGTPGHTPGGTCYLVETTTPLLCFVGDTLFAGSIGRSNPATLYETHLDSVRQRVLTLPPSTILLPGHGPATTVAEEREHNPFATEWS